MAYPETTEFETFRLSENESFVSPDEVEQLAFEIQESLKRKRVLNAQGFFNQNRTICADYFANVLPIVFYEYSGDMDEFVGKYCFSPDNHGDRICLAKILQEEGYLNKYYQPISEEAKEILRSFLEETHFNPYGKAPQITIENFWENWQDTHEEKHNVDDFYLPENY